MNITKTIEQWKENLNDIELIKELNSLSPSELNESFYRNLAFGTGGLRGIMGPGTNRVNIFTIRKVTKGLADFLNTNDIKNQMVAISYDNRKNSKVFAFEAANVLAANGIGSYVFENLRPTPMLSYAVRHFNCQAGIMVTASHNPKEYNGYKVYNEQGCQVNLEQANTIINLIDRIDNPFTIETSKNSDLIKIIDDSFDQLYLDEVKKIRINTPKSSVKAVYSPLHGTGSTVIPNFIKSEGYDIYPLEKQMTNDANFSNTTSSNPEDKASYTKSIKYAKEIDADIILVTDPDADRLGISVKHNNEYVLVNGNQTASLMLYYILDERTKNNTLPKNGCVFTTVVTSNLMKDIATSYNMKVVTTLTGFKFIGEQAELLKDTHEYVFGAEESYGSLVKDFVRDKDAVQAVYLLIEIASFLKDQNMTIIDYLEVINTKYGLYHEETENITLTGMDGANKIISIMNYFRNESLLIDNYKLLGYDDFEGRKFYDQENKNLPSSDVIKFYFDNDLVIIFRPSGTEPKLKIYYSIKGTNKQTLITELKEVSLVINNLIDKI